MPPTDPPSGLLRQLSVGAILLTALRSLMLSTGASKARGTPVSTLHDAVQALDLGVDSCDPLEVGGGRGRPGECLLTQGDHRFVPPHRVASTRFPLTALSTLHRPARTPLPVAVLRWSCTVGASNDSTAVHRRVGCTVAIGQPALGDQTGLPKRLSDGRLIRKRTRTPSQGAAVPVRFMTIPWASSGTQAYDNHGVQPEWLTQWLTNGSQPLDMNRHRRVFVGRFLSMKRHHAAPVDTEHHHPRSSLNSRVRGSILRRPTPPRFPRSS